MNTNNNLLNKTTSVQKSWPAGEDERLDESLELLELFKGEPAVDNASKVLKQERLAKALDKPKKKRAFQLTLNQIERWEKLKNYILGFKSLNYAIACQEKAPTTEHPHIHLYCQFKTPVGLSLKKTEGAHIETAYGSPQQNVDYIYKRGEYATKKHSPDDEANIIFEWGEIREAGGAAVETIKNLREADEETLMNQNVYLSRIVKDELTRRANIITVKDWYCPKEIYYIHGPSGAGKTQFTKWKCEQLGIEQIEVIKKEGDFYHGANMENETAIYDDFRDGDMKPSEFINLIDYNTHPMNIKHGTVINRYRRIFITSVFSPRSLWENAKARDETSLQWLRRINHCIYINENHEAYEEDPKTGETKEKIKEFNIDYLLNNIN